MDAPLSVISGSNVLVRRIDKKGQRFSLDFFEGELHTHMLGLHQILNAALAVRAVTPFVSNHSVRVGLDSTVWIGRVETLKDNPLVILDGAHNAGGMKTFCDTVNELFSDQFPNSPPRVIIGILKDKEYEKMLEVLFSSIRFPVKSVTCVTVPQERALAGSELADVLRCICEEHLWFYNDSTSMYNMQDKIYDSDDPKSSCISALQLSYSDHAPIICVGSLYLVGHVRDIFIDNVEGESYSGLE
jgi:dihydrofolate synthase/folylpolyglutamate synthase